MTATLTPQQQEQLDATYRAQRLQLNRNLIAAVARAWASLYKDRTLAINTIVGLVEAGQMQVVQLVEAYLAAKQLATTGTRSDITLNPEQYTPTILRGLPAAAVYARPFGAYGAFIKDGAAVTDALQAGEASVTKLAGTDMQLAQTNAARDWMQQTAKTQPKTGIRIVGYRRVLNPPSCELCTLAAKRTYRISDLMPIHEHCDCSVEPLWGTKPVASIGTTVRIENDPELGPRLMADSWSSVGPRLID